MLAGLFLGIRASVFYVGYYSSTVFVSTFSSFSSLSFHLRGVMLLPASGAAVFWNGCASAAVLDI